MSTRVDLDEITNQLADISERFGSQEVAHHDTQTEEEVCSLLVKAKTQLRRNVMPTAEASTWTLIEHFFSTLLTLNDKMPVEEPLFAASSEDRIIAILERLAGHINFCRYYEQSQTHRQTRTADLVSKEVDELTKRGSIVKQEAVSLAGDLVTRLKAIQ